MKPVPFPTTIVRVILCLLALLLAIIALAGGTIFNLTGLKELAVAVILLAVAVFIP